MKNLTAPFIYALEITDKCNLSCPLCGNVFEKNNVSSLKLTLDDWKNILEKIRPYAREIRITGGEPTICPYFFDILKEVDSRNLPFHIFTNGLWENAKVLLGKLKNFPRFSSFLISFHGLDFASFSKFSGQGFSREHFDKIVENIKYAVKAGCTVNTNTVLGKNNFTQIELITAFLISLGVSNISFERLIGPENDALKMREDELKAALSKIGELKNSGKPVLCGSCVPGCFFETDSVGCSSGLSFATIDHLGCVKPCSHSPVEFGNILKDSIEDIWKSASAQRWRQNIPKECSACGSSFICAGACRAAGELINAEKDPLIRKSLPNRGKKTVDIVLDDSIIPIANFSVKKEKKDYIVINDRNDFLFLDENNAAFLNFIKDNARTLKEIEAKFGKEKLALLYSLHLRGFVDLPV